VRAFAASAKRGAALKGLEIVHPEYRLIDPNARLAPEEHLTPIYPLTEGVTQGRLRLLIRMALDQTAAGDIEDWLPPLFWPIRACLPCAMLCSMSIGRRRMLPWIYC